ncbi:MAG: hypothetical protein OHK0037_27730 [Elainellaceae cyanobacterium]
MDIESLAGSELVATSKAKVMAYIEPELKEDLERLADVRNRSISNLLETLIRDEIEQAKTTGELKPPVQQGK